MSDSLHRIEEMITSLIKMQATNNAKLEELYEMQTASNAKIDQLFEM